MRPIPDWLKTSRLSQTMPGERRPWTQDHLLERMQADIGWAPHRPNYSKYESGKATPQPDTLDRFVAFWAIYGIGPPDLNPPAPAPPEDPIRLLVDELRVWRTEDRRRIADLEATVGRLSKALLDARGTEGQPDSPAHAGTVG